MRPNSRLEILTQVALSTRLGDGIPHLRQFHLFHMAEFLYELVVALL